VRYWVGGEGFAFVADYGRCANLDVVIGQGAAAFAPFVCLSELGLSDAFGWGLTRTQTLADGCDRCDFRFRPGGPTRIRSSLPPVQAAIEASRAASAALVLDAGTRERGQEHRVHWP
jgi:hypothetical protein